MRGKRGLGWLVRAALVTLGLAGVVYAGQQVEDPPGEDLAKTVQAQRAGEGRKLTTEEIEHQRETLTPQQMLQLSTTYQAEMATAVEHGEALRIAAYRTRDIIRITCIDDKLAQMKEVIKLVTPRFLTVQKLENEPIHIRGQFVFVQQAHDRMTELATEIESCVGDNVDVVAYGRIKQDIPQSDNVFDPTRPPGPTQIVDRPPEASPFR
jgi:hypothetical protein